MTRAHLEHLLRAAGAISQEDMLVVVGSQAILGSYVEPPELLTVSVEADIFPLNAPYKADLIDGSIGERSPFHDTFGYYAHGVGPETAIVPLRWLSRAVALCNENTGGVTGLCLHPLDLAVSKLMAGRNKDFAYVRTMISESIVPLSALMEISQEMTSVQRNRLKECLSLL